MLVAILLERSMDLLGCNRSTVSDLQEKEESKWRANMENKKSF